jgi:hypothetical protein
MKYLLATAAVLALTSAATSAGDPVPLPRPRPGTEIMEEMGRAQRRMEWYKPRATTIDYMRRSTLPPVEYDKPYDGKLEEIVAKDYEEMRAFCNRSIACCKPCGGLIAVLSILRPMRLSGAHGLTTDILRRHEIAHCNGWPKDHPGTRPLDSEETKLK